MLERWGERLRDALDEVSARLTTAELVRLNRVVEIDGRTPAEAAAEWWDAGDGRQTIAPRPVIARPTMRVLTSRVPS